MNRLLMIVMVLIAGMAQLQDLQAQQLKIISFNIHSNYSPKDDGQNAWHLRQKAVLKMIDSEEPDVIGVQEALLEQMAAIDKKFKNKYRRIGVGRDNGLTRGEHTAIYYDKNKLQLISYKTRWLCPTPQTVSIGWDAATPRIVTYARFRVKDSGKEFYYFNTHLEKEGTVAHTESVKLIAQLIEQEANASTPVIIGGDMNSYIDNDDFLPLYDKDFVPARTVAPRTDYRNSYNAFGNRHGKMTDHFIVRNVNVLRFKTIIKSYGVPYISDHYPISIIFNL